MNERIAQMLKDPRMQDVFTLIEIGETYADHFTEEEQDALDRVIAAVQRQ